MLFEKKWPLVIQSFTADGTMSGLVTVASTDDFRAKQLVHISAAGLDTLELEVKRVISATELYVGEPGRRMETRTDVSDYTTALAAQITAHEQPRPAIQPNQILRAVYAEEPAVAFRVLSVDVQGNPIGGSGGIASDVNVSKWGNAATTLGQKPMSSSVPVTLASDQSPLPVSVTIDLDPDVDGVSVYGVDESTALQQLYVDPTGRARVITGEQGAMVDVATQVVVSFDETAFVDLIDYPLPSGETLFLGAVTVSVASAYAEAEVVVVDGATTTPVRHYYFNGGQPVVHEVFPRYREILGNGTARLKIRARAAANVGSNYRSGTGWAAINGYRR